MSEAERLTFVSTRFLYPVDSGGKIRTTQILRGLKGGRFRIRLVSPATPEETLQYAADLTHACDGFDSWRIAPRDRLFHLARLRHLASSLPIPIRTDWNRAGAELVRRSVEHDCDVAVFDFLHAAVLAPRVLACPTVLFTHNVEAEIFERHGERSKGPLMRGVWRNQSRKMRAFEHEALRRFDVIVAVSDRDADLFAKHYGIERPFVIPTGVDLEFFRFNEPTRDREVVFCGSMDWLANQDAVGYFLDNVWASIAARVPDARMTVIGRTPPEALVQRAKRLGVNWTFTGFVDDVRPHLYGAAVSVIPMRIAGGTRLKVYESMSAGTPVVSTSIGVEGLPVESGRHYLNADTAVGFADAVVTFLQDRVLRQTVARDARTYVESRFSYQAAARVFEDACALAMRRYATRAPRGAVGAPVRQAC